MRLPWSRRPPADTDQQAAEVDRVRRLQQQAEQLSDRLALAVDALEQALEERQRTMRPYRGEPS